jgi:hypothetical protein
MNPTDIPSSLNVSIDDLSHYEWQGYVAQASGNLFALCDILIKAIREADAKGEERTVRVYRFLHAIASFMPNFDLKTNAFQPMFSSANGQRSPIGEDLVSSDLATLNGILGDIKDPTFRARVGDVLWECKKDHAAARVAIQAYQESAETVSDWNLGGDSLAALRRATQLAAKLGFDKPLHVAVVDLVREKVSAAAGDLSDARRLLAHSLMEILLDLSKVSPAEYARLSENLAVACRTLDDRSSACKYYDLASQWHRRAKKEADVERCQSAEAEDLAALAEASVAAGEHGYGQAEHYLERSIHILRSAHGDSDRVEQLIRRFVEVQGLAATNAKTMEFHFSEITGFNETTAQASAAAAAHVQGHDFETAIARLVHITEVTDVDQLREQYSQMADQSPLLAIMGAAAVNSTGQTTGKLEPALRAGVSDESTMAERLTHHATMFHWKTKAGWFIEPARMTILAEHPIRLRDLVYLVENNDFVPPGHEGIYLRGLQSGFYGDWLASMSFLLSQVEASIRNVLKNRGIPTISVTTEGIQEEIDINQLLDRDDVKTIFGAGIIFDLRALLIERFGFNMRNRDSHGLMPEGAYYQEGSVYLWWLLLRLCYCGRSLGQEPSGLAAA